MWSRREATDQPSAAAPLVIAFASHCVSNEILVSVHYKLSDTVCEL